MINDMVVNKYIFRIEKRCIDVIFFDKIIFFFYIKIFNDELIIIFKLLWFY